MPPYSLLILIGVRQTHGQISNWHPQIHALTTYGAFTSDDTFIPFPDDLSTTPFREVWEAKIFRLLLDEGRITPEVVGQMRAWQHSGFSVDKSVALATGDTGGLECVAAYMVRCPFSLDRMVSVSDDLSACGHAQADGKVVYRAEKAHCQPLPVLGDGKLLRGVPRNFEVFDPLEFLAEITQHIPDPGMQMVRYYGWYSNKTRGRRAKAADSSNLDAAAIEADGEDTPYRKLARMRWAALIKRVWEVDPLLCPKCGGTMKIVAFIEKQDQADVIEKILKHCSLWDRPASRASPQATGPPVQPVLELEYVNEDEFLMAL